MFGRKKRTQVHYNDTIPADRVWNQSHTISLRAVGSHDGYPMVYAVSPTQISLKWKGKEQYKDAVQAVIAAEAHIEDTFQRVLADTPERRLAFDWDRLQD